MADVEIYEDAAEVVAKLDGVGDQLSKVAHSMGAVASAALAARHGQTDRLHNLRSPKIVVGKYGTVDYYVALEAWSVKRATGIEFGHRYQSKAKNRSGPWGQSSGIGVLASAIGFAVAGWGGF